jgi:KaiC/GvpD/RAD55 family RecA-like ATPase
MCDNIIVLSTAKRRISIVKARATAHDLGSHEVEIDGDGLRVIRHAGVSAPPAALS